MIGWVHGEGFLPTRGDDDPDVGVDDCAAWIVPAAEFQRRAQLLHAVGVLAFVARELLRRQTAVAGYRRCSNASGLESERSFASVCAGRGCGDNGSAFGGRCDSAAVSAKRRVHSSNLACSNPPMLSGSRMVASGYVMPFPLRS